MFFLILFECYFVIIGRVKERHWCNLHETMSSPVQIGSQVKVGRLLNFDRLPFPTGFPSKEFHYLYF